MVGLTVTQPGNRSRGGFTLTEVVVASTILILAIVPILKGLTTSHLDSADIERRAKSLSYARAVLDEIRAESVYNYNTNFAAADVSLGGGYMYTLSDPGYGGDLRHITVQVGHDTSGNVALSAAEVRVSLETLIAKRW